MLDEREDRIKSEAYRRWEQEGRPEGEHDRHWLEAAGAVEAEKADVKVAKPKAPKLKAAAKAEPDIVVADAPKRGRSKKAP
jgi:hypothetical protein